MTDYLNPMHKLSSSEIRWCWVYLATLTLETPLSILQRHGDTVVPEKVNGMSAFNDPFGTPALSEKESSYASWVIVEDGDHDEGSLSNNIVMDIPDDACQPARYLSFLVKLRVILESEALPRKKRQQLREWFALETWNDIFVCWGGEDAFVDRVVPSFLTHLAEQGISTNITDQLDILGIDNRLALTRLLHGRLGLDAKKDILGVGGAVLERLEMFCISDDLLRQFDQRGEVKAELKDELSSISLHLEDPFIQVTF